MQVCKLFYKDEKEFNSLQHDKHFRFSRFVAIKMDDGNYIKQNIQKGSPCVALINLLASPGTRFIVLKNKEVEVFPPNSR